MPLDLENEGWKNRGLKERDEKDGKTLLPLEEKIQSWLHSSRISPETREKILRLSSSLPVFILGEEGTGRSGVAKAIHFLGPWKNRPFLRFFCRHLTPERFIQKISFWLKGAARGASVSLTLFLEEVEHLEWDLQATFLDLWHDHQIGWPGLEEISIEAKMISASTAPLSQAVAAGLFRSDLSQVLEIQNLVLPPLRKRQEEIPRLVDEILQEQAAAGIAQKKFSPEALQMLQQYNWPGNLRELESLVLRSAASKEGDLLRPKDLIFSLNGEESLPSSEEGKRVEGTRPLPFAPQEETGPVFDATLSTLRKTISSQRNPFVAFSTGQA